MTSRTSSLLRVSVGRKPPMGGGGSGGSGGGLGGHGAAKPEGRTGARGRRRRPEYRRRAQRDEDTQGSAPCGREAPSAALERRARAVTNPTEADLVAKIREIWEGSDRTYGEPRLTRPSWPSQGWKDDAVWTVRVRGA